MQLYFVVFPLYIVQKVSNLKASMESSLSLLKRNNNYRAQVGDNNSSCINDHSAMSHVCYQH